MPQWIFQFRVVFSFAHRRFRPSASSFAPASVETPFGKLNFGSMCGMFVYGCDLLALPRYGHTGSLSLSLPPFIPPPPLHHLSLSHSLLLARRALPWEEGSESRWSMCGRRGEERAKFVDFEPSERGEFVDIPPRHPMYREPSWKLLVTRLAAGAPGWCLGQTSF